MPPVLTEYFPLGGGLDLVSPQIEMSPGRALAALNYEVSNTGGYSRVDGFERFDGRNRPSDATYRKLGGTGLSVVPYGTEILGLTSNATGIAIYSDSSTLIVAELIGAFVPGETLRIDTGPIGVNDLGSSPTADEDNQYSEMAANYRRSMIGAVPGSGPVRGVHVYKDQVYAFRDNPAGTACNIYRATGLGWSAITLGMELAFNTGGATPVVVSDTLVGATSGASGVVQRVVLESGAWDTTNAAGRFVFTAITGTFQVGEVLRVGGVNRAVATAVQGQISLLPGGKFRIVNHNFSGSADTLRMYGCDGVNRGWEFDGQTLIFVRTGMEADAPEHVAAHKSHLFFSFKGSLQHSAPGQPFKWSVILGAAELAAGDQIVGLLPVPGNEDSGALAIFCRSRTLVLYGSSVQSWQLSNFSSTTGALVNTIQLLGTPIYLDDLGITTLAQTAAFGNFERAALSKDIKPQLDAKFQLACASVIIRKKNQYKLFFSDGTGYTVTFRDQKMAGIMPFDLGRKVECTVEGEIAGEPRVFFGSSDGVVYEMNRGRSFDGAPVEHSLRLGFNHAKSPRMRKRYRRAIVEIEPKSAASISIQPEFSYGTTDIGSPAAREIPVPGKGGRWSEALWSQFYWSAPEYVALRIPLEGTGTNVSFAFYGRSAVEKSFTIQSVMLDYTPRRMER